MCYSKWSYFLSNLNTSPTRWREPVTKTWNWVVLFCWAVSLSHWIASGRDSKTELALLEFAPFGPSLLWGRLSHTLWSDNCHDKSISSRSEGGDAREPSLLYCDWFGTNKACSKWIPFWAHVSRRRGSNLWGSLTVMQLKRRIFLEFLSAWGCFEEPSCILSLFVTWTNHLAHVSMLSGLCAPSK